MKPRERINKILDKANKQCEDIINTNYKINYEKYQDGMRNEFLAWESIKEEWDSKAQVEKEKEEEVNQLRKDLKMALQYIQDQGLKNDFFLYKRQRQDD